MKYLVVSPKPLTLDFGRVYHSGDIVEDPTNPDVLIRRGMAIPLPETVTEAVPTSEGYVHPELLEQPVTEETSEEQAEDDLSPSSEPASETSDEDASASSEEGSDAEEETGETTETADGSEVAATDTGVSGPSTDTPTAAKTESAPAPKVKKPKA